MASLADVIDELVPADDNKPAAWHPENRDFEGASSVLEREGQRPRSNQVQSVVPRAL